MWRAGLGGLLLVSLLFAATPVAGAQSEGCKPPLLAFQDAPPLLEAGGTFVLRFAIENPNGPPVESVRATVTTTVPAGWTATARQRDLTLGPQGIAFDELTITAPHRGTGEPMGNVTVLVTLVCTIGVVQTSASQAVQFEVELASLRVPWPLVLSAFGLLTVGVVMLGVRRLRRGVAMVPVVTERPIEAGKSAKFTFQVENRRGKPGRFHLLASLPEGWGVHLALEEIDLEPGEEKLLWAIVKAPAQAVVGDAVEIALRLEGSRGGRDSASLPLLARVAPPS